MFAWLLKLVRTDRKNQKNRKSYITPPPMSLIP